MYHYALIGYMLWKYSDVFEYSFKAIKYTSKFAHYMFKVPNEDWILIEPKYPNELTVIKEEIEFPDELP